MVVGRANGGIFNTFKGRWMYNRLHALWTIQLACARHHKGDFIFGNAKVLPTSYFSQ